MSKTFDPYYKWLGIPPADQPANFYRLLGINLYEANADVIESAADQRMVHLRSFQTGQHAAASQKLLNEVSNAKLWLLKPEKKAQYDAKLRARLAAKATAAAEQSADAAEFDPALAAAEAPAANADWQSEAMQFTPATGRRKSTAAVGRKSSSPPMMLLVGGPVVAIVVIVGVIFAINSGKSDTGQADSPGDGQQVAVVTPIAADKKHDDRFPPATGGTGSAKTNGQADPGALRGNPASSQTSTTVAPATGNSDSDGSNSGPTPESDLAGTGITASDLARRQQLKMPDEATLNKKPLDNGPDSAGAKAADGPDKLPAVPGDPSPTKEADSANGTAANPAPEPRLPVPSDAAQQKALQELKDVMKDDYAQAKTPDAQLAFAKKLQKLADDTKDDANSRFVTYSQALELAVKTGAADLALQLVETLGKSFDLDVWDLRQKTLTQLARIVKSADVRATIAKSALDLAEQALPDSHYDSAIALTTIAMNLSTSLKDNILRDQCRELSERTKRLQKEQPAYELAQQKLKTVPDDADANLAVGRVACLLQDDWKGGLPNLLKGTDEALKALAKLELADPTDAEAQAKLGDGWWDQADKQGAKKDDPIVKSMHNRAMYWYRLALPNLTGLTLAKVQKRIDAEEASKPEAPIKETAYLDDMDEQNLSLANTSLGKHGETGYEVRGFGNFGRGSAGGKGGRGVVFILPNTPTSVALGGVEAKHALSLMPKSNGDATVAYKLDGKYRQFTGTAAIMDGDNPQSAVIFRVYADGKLIWTSKPMHTAGDSQNCTLRINKTQALQFEILCNGPNANAHTAWINPTVGR